MFTKSSEEVSMDSVLTMHTLQPHQPPTVDRVKQLAQAYVKPQPFDGVFSPDVGVCKGTIFPNLSQPYAGWQKRHECK